MKFSPSFPPSKQGLRTCKRCKLDKDAGQFAEQGKICLDCKRLSADEAETRRKEARRVAARRQYLRKKAQRAIEAEAMVAAGLRAAQGMRICKHCGESKSIKASFTPHGEVCADCKQGNPSAQSLHILGKLREYHAPAERICTRCGESKLISESFTSRGEVCTDCKRSPGRVSHPNESGAQYHWRARAALPAMQACIS